MKNHVDTDLVVCRLFCTKADIRGHDEGAVILSLLTSKFRCLAITK